MSRHTAGPWVLGTEFADQGWTVTGLNGRFVENIYRDSDFPEESEANARLIAAAPELLTVAEDCRRILTWLSGQRDLNKVEIDMLSRAEAAITRATQPLPPPNEEV